MPVDTDNRELAVSFFELCSEHVQIGHDRVIDELRVGQVDDNRFCVLARNGPLERDPGTEDSRSLDLDGCRAVASSATSNRT